MKLKKEIKVAFTVLMAVAILIGGFSTRAYAAENKNVDVETQKDDSKVSQKKKQEKEYAKWKIKKINGKYFYKQKDVRLLVDDTGKKPVTNNFYCNKKGEVDIKVIRNKKDRIKKIRYISKKKAKEILENFGYGMTYYIGKK